MRKPAAVLQKNKQGFGYTYVSEDEILAKITGTMERQNVSLIPMVKPGTTRVEPYSYKKTKVLKNGTVIEENVNEILVIAEMTWKWICDDNPDDFIEVPWVLVGQQSDASQAFGSALTYSSRYFLLKYFNIATSNDDPDTYRTKQKEASNYEDQVVTKEIIKQIDTYISETLEKNPELHGAISEKVKEVCKVNGKKSANYRLVTDPMMASEILSKIKEVEVVTTNKQKSTTNQEGK